MFYNQQIKLSNNFLKNHEMPRLFLKNCTGDEVAFPEKLETWRKYLTQNVAIQDLLYVKIVKYSMFLVSVWAIIMTEERTLTTSLWVAGSNSFNFIHNHIQTL